MSENEQWDIVSGLGLTALAVALARALETHRPDGLISDPFAAAFVAAAELPAEYAHWPRPGSPAAEPDSLWNSLPPYLGVRTRVFDDYLAAACAAGIRQVVLVAAGLDSRTFRLDWPAGTEVFEVDQPLVVKFKDEVLDGLGARPRCVRHTVAVDLREDWPAALRTAGFDHAEPTAWLAEGLLAFLPPAVEADLFARIGQLSAPGSRLGLEAAPGNDRHGVLKSRFASAEERIGIPLARLWRFESRPEPIDVLAADGWSVAIERVIEASLRYGHPVPGVMNEAAQYTKLVIASR
jgi:methyltransferase (TIGR00027 family)